MNTKPPVLTKDNTKMLAVEAATHRQAKQLAAQLGLTMYQTAALAFEKLALSLSHNGDDHANT